MTGNYNEYRKKRYIWNMWMLGLKTTHNTTLFHEFNCKEKSDSTLYYEQNNKGHTKKLWPVGSSLTPVVDQINHDLHSWDHCVTHTFSMNKDKWIMQKRDCLAPKIRKNMDEARPKRITRIWSGCSGWLRWALERGSVLKNARRVGKLKGGYKGEEEGSREKLHEISFASFFFWWGNLSMERRYIKPTCIIVYS